MIPRGMTDYACCTKGCPNRTRKMYCEPCLQPPSPPNGAKRGPTLPPRPEEEIRREIVTWARLSGAEVWDLEQNRPTRQTPGMSDLVICWPGRGVFFVEVKAEDGKQSAAQIDFQKAVLASGGRYVLARSIEDCERGFGA